eukprot:TRINITY_DN3208_c0_g2_i1.p1 TRINITY_DN3208_c0_g2~~TRINITY_DN3208_c0_g2_i1.p1  ORF type:complete len:349 (-),score=68.74 TRINITY_DN3208_c0_g2_i1:135-1181(-)
MAPKKRKQPSARARSQKVIERDVLTTSAPSFWRPQGSQENICGACLLPVEPDAKVGLIDNCQHIFHFDCVSTWSKTENSCPQCKQRFFWLASYSSKGKRASLEKVERKDQEGEEDPEYEDVQVCEHCKEVGDESRLLLCDGMNGTCNAPYHIECVGLTDVPKGSWFCPDCVERGFDTDSRGRRGTGQRLRVNPPEASSASVDADDVDTPSEGSRLPPPSNDAEVESIGASAPTPESIESLRAELTSAAAEAVASRRRIRGRGQQVPSQLRLNSLACVTPAVEVPSFQAPAPTAAASSDGDRGGIFASFVQRRRAQRAASGAGADSSSSFIKLNPTYEDDFMGGKASKS